MPIAVVTDSTAYLPDECVRRSLEGLRRGRAEVVVDPVDRAVVRLPHPLLERVDA